MYSFRVYESNCLLVCINSQGFLNSLIDSRGLLMIFSVFLRKKSILLSLVKILSKQTMNLEIGLFGLSNNHSKMLVIVYRLGNRRFCRWDCDVFRVDLQLLAYYYFRMRFCFFAEKSKIEN